MNEDTEATTNPNSSQAQTNTLVEILKEKAGIIAEILQSDQGSLN